MTINTTKISKQQADTIRLIDENQFGDLKAKEVSPNDLTKHISAFANADGGDLYIGITDKERVWNGFKDTEAANGHIQALETYFPLGTDFLYEFLASNEYLGSVLHIQINKTLGVIKASNGVPYLRRGAQSLPINTPDRLKLLELSKGLVSFENEIVNISKEVVIESEVIQKFVEHVVPTTTPEKWLKKQNLIREDRPTVAGVLIFADEPQAAIPKHCGIKIYRYKTRDNAGFRDALAEDPITVEGDIYTQIHEAVRLTKEITETIPKLTDSGVENIKYPQETLHEILTNAILHRDYSIKDDVHVRIFDDRIEVQSPGRLPANITPKNILDERFARNGALVRIMNKFPSPPNKDVGEGLNTAFAKMTEIGLKTPIIRELENAVLVIIRHEPLASPVEIIIDYLEKNGQIKNAKAREIAHIPTDFRMKGIFNKMEQAGKIRKVPGTRTSSTAWELAKNIDNPN